MSTTQSTSAPVTSSMAGGSVACPATVALTVSTGPRNGLEPVVPAQPTVPGQDQRLVPTDPPSEAVICRYLPVAIGIPSTPGTAALDASGAVTTGLHELVRALAALPAPTDYPGPASCTDMGGPLIAYLLGLDYPTGRVWVAASEEPNRCSGASNGRFETRRYAGDLVKEAAASNPG